MTYKSDIEIAQSVKLQDIREIAKKLDLTDDDIELYGKYKAKVDYNLLKNRPGKKAKLVLTTAMLPHLQEKLRQQLQSVLLMLFQSWAKKQLLHCENPH